MSDTNLGDCRICGRYTDILIGIGDSLCYECLNIEEAREAAKILLDFVEKQPKNHVVAAAATFLKLYFFDTR